MQVDALNDLDLSYTPPLSSPWDPLQTMNCLVGYLTENCCGDASVCVTACEPERASRKAPKMTHSINDYGRAT
jgi:hypothetical protein